MAREGRQRVTPIGHASRRSRVDRALAPYIQEPGLWPVTIVLLAHAAVGVAVAMLDAIRGGIGFGRVALALLLVASAFAFGHDARRRRFGIATGALVTAWVGGALFAWGADHFGLY